MFFRICQMTNSYYATWLNEEATFFPINYIHQQYKNNKIAMELKSFGSRLWEVKNRYNGDVIFSIELILQDEKLLHFVPSAI